MKIRDMTTGWIEAKRSPDWIPKVRDYDALLDALAVAITELKDIADDGCNSDWYGRKVCGICAPCIASRALDTEISSLGGAS